MKEKDRKARKWREKMSGSGRVAKRLVYTRFFILALLVLEQAVFYVAGIVWLNAQWWAVSAIFSAISLIFVFYLFVRTDRPSTKLSWILLVVLFPVVGVSAYLIFGDGRPMKRLIGRIEKEKRTNELAFTAVAKPSTQPCGTGGYYLEKNGFPAFSDGDVDYYPTGKEAFARMLEDIDGAKEYILLEYFIVAGGKMWEMTLEKLLKKAQDGVKIYLIYDDFGSLLTLPPRYDRHLEGLHENIRCVRFNPVRPFFSARMNNRDHRKMLVVDGKVAYTGGINLADEYIDEKKRFGYWKDTAVRVTGGAVGGFVVAFFNLYNAVKKWERVDVSPFLHRSRLAEGEGVIQPYDDCPGDKKQTAETVYLNLVEGAKERLYITTPYLVIDDFMRSALCRAALRGVDVRIVTPGIPDKKLVYRLTRANYDILMRAGVKIYEYTPGFMHAKCVLADEEAVVGTVNFDYRSLYHHFENAVCFSKQDGVAALEKDFVEIFGVSKLCTEADVKRGFFGRLLDANLRVFETLL